MRGRDVVFHTALAAQHGASGAEARSPRTHDVRFRAFSEDAIERYLAPSSPTTARAAPRSRAWASRSSSGRRRRSDRPHRPAADRARRDARRARARRPAAGVSAGTLYLVPTPLAADAAARRSRCRARPHSSALGTSSSRKPEAARRFLKCLGTRGRSRRSPSERLPRNPMTLIAPLLAGEDAGLVSRGGCPAVADPGAALVRLAHERGVRVVPLVGPSAVLLALMASGLNGQRFEFHGYLPVEAGARSRLRELEASPAASTARRSSSRHRTATTPAAAARATARRHARSASRSISRCRRKRSRPARSRNGGAAADDRAAGGVPARPSGRKPLPQAAPFPASGSARGIGAKRKVSPHFPGPSRR